jgi:hypothetical protein
MRRLFLGGRRVEAARHENRSRPLDGSARRATPAGARSQSCVALTIGALTCDPSLISSVRAAFSPSAPARSLCRSARDAAGDKAAYENAQGSREVGLRAATKRCDAMTGNAKDICVAEARRRASRPSKTPRPRTRARRRRAPTPSPRIAEANYKVAKERCDDRTGNDRDVCIKVAKAELTRAKADAKAKRKIAEARQDAAKDKREADYKVAAQKCEALSGDAKSACSRRPRRATGM